MIFGWLLWLWLWLWLWQEWLQSLQQPCQLPTEVVVVSTGCTRTGM
jgi:hypothetical protein